MILLVVMAVAVATTAPATGVAPTANAASAPAGAAGIGDPLFELAGNGGYDVARYDLALDVNIAAGTIREATARIAATATVDLARFNLDFRGLDIASVRVDDEPAAWRRQDAELTVAPTRPIPAGTEFLVEIDYRGDPARSGVEDRFQQGWQAADGQVFVAGEPGGAENWFPVNGHPADAAAYTLRISVPDGTEVVAGGELVTAEKTGGRTTFTWENDDEIPAYLATFAAGDFELLQWVEAVGDRTIPVLYALPADATEREREIVDRTGEMLRFFSGRFGPFPSDRIGGVVVERFGAALETEEMVVYGRGALEERTVAHEIAHHWFGNSVRLARWSDVWLNEGFARYSEALWAEHEGGAEERDRVLAEQARTLQAGWRDPARRFAIGDPPADRLFDGAVYNRGSLTLHALRGELGDERFFGLLREWHARYAGDAVTTAQFIALAEEFAGRDLAAFFDAWLYEAELPPSLLSGSAATPVATAAHS
jgi:aminopeptidase N